MHFHFEVSQLAIIRLMAPPERPRPIRFVIHLIICDFNVRTLCVGLGSGTIAISCWHMFTLYTQRAISVLLPRIETNCWVMCFWSWLSESGCWSSTRHSWLMGDDRVVATSLNGGRQSSFSHTRHTTATNTRWRSKQLRVLNFGLLNTIAQIYVCLKIWHECICFMNSLHLIWIKAFKS